MPKLLHRIVAILLAFCFIADPAAVSACALFQRPISVRRSWVFPEQALAPALANWMVPSMRRFSQGIGTATRTLIESARHNRENAEILIVQATAEDLSSPKHFPTLVILAVDVLGDFLFGWIHFWKVSSLLTGILAGWVEVPSTPFPKTFRSLHASFTPWMEKGLRVIWMSTFIAGVYDMWRLNAFLDHYSAGWAVGVILWHLYKANAWSHAAFNVVSVLLDKQMLVVNRGMDSRPPSQRIRKVMSKQTWAQIGTVAALVKDIKISSKVFRTALRNDAQLKEAFNLWRTQGGLIPFETAESSGQTLSSVEKEELLKKGLALVDARSAAIDKVAITRASIAAALDITPKILDSIPTLGPYIDKHEFYDVDARIFNALKRIAASIERPRGEIKMQALARLIPIELGLLIAGCTTPLIDEVVAWALAGEWDRIARQEKVVIVEEKPAVASLRNKLNPFVDKARFVAIARESSVPLPRLTNFIKCRVELTPAELTKVSQAIDEVAGENAVRYELQPNGLRKINQAA